MTMNNEEKDTKQQMMSDEYGREFGGCLWLFIAAMIGIVVLGCLVMFT